MNEKITICKSCIQIQFVTRGIQQSSQKKKLNSPFLILQLVIISFISSLFFCK